MRQKKKTKASKLQKNGLLFVLPSIAIYTFVIGIPSIMTILYAFTDWRIGTTPTFVGLANFRHMLDPTESVIWRALKNNVVWMILMVVANTGLAIIVSGCLLNVGNMAKKIFRVIFFIPIVLPRTVVASVWGWLYNPITGLKPILNQIGLSFPGIGNPSTVMYAIAIVGVWCWWGFPLVIFLSALQQIDPVYYEAARLEGANRLQIFTKITLPLIKSSILFVLVLTIISSFQIFDLIYIMTNGGPGRSSEVLATLIYKNGILQFNAGYASAISVLQLAVSSVGIFAYIALQRKGVEEV